MSTRWRELVAVALALLAAGTGGCARAWFPLEPEPSVTVELDEAETLAFRRRIQRFYDQLLQRRFNTLETFNDAVLREHFRSLDLFFDYYADFAQALAEAHFEKSRPNAAVVLDYAFDGSEQARVLVRFTGSNRRPLRFGNVVLDRVDRWERAEGTWWVTPERL